MGMHLRTRRLVLRPFTGADTDHLLALHGDREVMRFIDGGEPVSRRDIVRDTLPGLMLRHRCIDGPGYLTAERVETGEFLGWFEFRPVRRGSADTVELGYRLHRAAWGSGYATEGAEALIRRGFTDLDVRRVIARTMAVNAASRRVMEKAGLVHVRTFHLSWHQAIVGSQHGDVEYEPTRADWTRQHGGAPDGPPIRCSAERRPSRLRASAVVALDAAAVGAVGQHGQPGFRPRPRGSRSAGATASRPGCGFLRAVPDLTAGRCGPGRADPHPAGDFSPRPRRASSARPSTPAARGWRGRRRRAGPR